MPARKKPAERSRFAVYRDALRGGPPRELAPCGTWAAVKRHERKDETLDEACREARNAHQREMYEARKKKS